MIDVDFSSLSRVSQRDEAVRVVGESTQLSLIKALVDERGMDPIWVHLIKQFGSVMYLKGLDSSPPPLRTRLRKSA